MANLIADGTGMHKQTNADRIRLRSAASCKKEKKRQSLHQIFLREIRQQFPDS